MRNLLIMAMSMLTILAGTAITPSLPGIAAHFSDTPNIAYLSQMMLTIPALSIVFTAPIVGVIADRYGRRTVLISSLVIYGITGAGGLYQNSIEGILVSRALLGISVGAIMTVTSTLVADYFSGNARNRFFGYRSTSISIGGILFLVGGGFLAEISWRAPFAIYLLALVYALPAYCLIREPKTVTNANIKQVGRAAVWREHLRHAPIYAVGLIHFLLFYFIFTEVPFRMQELGTNSSAAIGVVLGTMTLTSALFSMVFSVIRSHLRTTSIMCLGFVPIAAGFAMISIANSIGMMMFSMAVIGCGGGLLIPTLSGTAVSNATPVMRARVAGVISAAVFLGQFLSPSFTYPLVQVFGNIMTFKIISASYIILTVSTFAVGIRNRRSTAQDHLSDR